ncbi:hypothetical protein JCM10212_004521 [Sporobolomyces blumeae]
MSNAPDVPRARKRPRVSPPPARGPNPAAAASAPPPDSELRPLVPPASTSNSNLRAVMHESLATISIERPATYSASPPAHSTFQLPRHLASFSYGPRRELVLDREARDQSLAVYREPRLGQDLNTGFDEAVWRDGTVDEGLDALLKTLSHYAASDPTGAVDDMLDKVAVITWRGMMTKLMLAVYEAEAAASRAGASQRAEGWEMNAMLVEGCLYLEESNPPSKLAAKTASETSFARQSYYGYSFESFCTTPPPGREPRDEPSRIDGSEFSVPNTNVQWCSVVKTNLGGFRSIIGGEVDCVRPGTNLDAIQTHDFIELKTNIAIQSTRDEANFERQKLLKHYVQSFLLGVPTITVGFRTRPGILTGLQTFRTLEIPRLVRGKPHAWDPKAALSCARSLVCFIHQTLSQHARSNDAMPHGNEDGDDDARAAYPVFRVSFDPRGGGGGGGGGGGRGATVSIRRVGRDEVERDVVGAKPPGVERLGFLLKSWVDEVERRRRRERKVVVEAEKGSAVGEGRIQR